MILAAIRHIILVESTVRAFAVALVSGTLHWETIPIEKERQPLAVRPMDVDRQGRRRLPATNGLNHHLEIP